MLSRIAESLFWIGRYVERADVTARILDVQTQLLVEDPFVDEDESCRLLLGIMGVEHDGPVDQRVMLRMLLSDASSDASIVATLGAARESARISALESAASRSCESTRCSRAARCPGRKSPRSSRFTPYATASKPSSAAIASSTSKSSVLQK